MAAPLLAVVLDRAHTRFFEVTAADAVELPGLRLPVQRGGKFHSDRQDSPGWGERDYHQRLREEERRHYRAVARRLQALERERSGGGGGVVLAGPGNSADALRESLPPVLQRQVIGTAHLNPTEVTPALVHRSATALRQAHQRDLEQALVRDVTEGLGTGRAENGTRAVLRALARNQVRTLLVRGDVRGSGFRCRDSGRLVLSAADCLGEGDPIPIPDVVAAAIEEATRQGADVTIIRDVEVAKAIDGLAALLRFG